MCGSTIRNAGSISIGARWSLRTKGSPYFDFYAEYFEPFYRREYGFLADYNRGLLELLCSLTHVPMPDFSESYVDAAAGDLDLRPKRKRGSGVYRRNLCAGLFRPHAFPA